MPLPPARTDGLRVEQTLPCGDGGGARQRGLAGPWRGRSGRRQRVPLDWQTAAAPFPGMTSEAAGAWAGSEWRKGGRQEGYRRLAATRRLLRKVPATSSKAAARLAYIGGGDDVRHRRSGF